MKVSGAKEPTQLTEAAQTHLNGFTCSTGWETVTGWNKCTGNALVGLNPSTVDVSAQTDPLQACQDACNGDAGCKAINFNSASNECKKFNSTPLIPFTFAGHNRYAQQHRTCYRDYTKEECISLPNGQETTDIDLPLGCIRKGNGFQWNNETSELRNVQFRTKTDSVCVGAVRTRELQSGTNCGGKNMADLTEDECEEYAGSAYTFQAVDDSSLSKGCSRDGSTVSFNTNFLPTGSCSSDSPCVCKRKPAPYILSNTDCSNLDGFTMLDAAGCTTAGNWLTGKSVPNSAGTMSTANAVNVDSNALAGTKCRLSGTTAEFNNPYTTVTDQKNGDEYDCGQHSNLTALKIACNGDSDCIGVSTGRENCSTEMGAASPSTGADKCREASCTTRVNQWGQCMDAEKQCLETYPGASACELNSNGTWLPSACKPNHAPFGQSVNNCNPAVYPWTAIVGHQDGSIQRFKVGSNPGSLSVRSKDSNGDWIRFDSNKCADPDDDMGTDASPGTRGWCYVSGKQNNSGVPFVLSDGSSGNRWDYCQKGATTTENGFTCQRWDCKNLDNRICAYCAPGFTKIWNGECMPIHKKTCLDTNKGAKDCHLWDNAYTPYTCRAGHRSRSYGGWANHDCSMCLPGYTRYTSTKGGGQCIKEGVDPDDRNYPIWSYYEKALSNRDGPWTCSGQTCLDKTKTSDTSKMCLFKGERNEAVGAPCGQNNSMEVALTETECKAHGYYSGEWGADSNPNFGGSEFDPYDDQDPPAGCVGGILGGSLVYWGIDSDSEEECNDTVQCMCKVPDNSSNPNYDVHFKPTETQTCSDSKNCLCKWDTPASSTSKGNLSLTQCQTECGNDTTCETFSHVAGECVLHACDDTSSDHLWDGVWKDKQYDFVTNANLACGHNEGYCMCKDHAYLEAETDSSVYIKSTA